MKFCQKSDDGHTNVRTDDGEPHIVGITQNLREKETAAATTTTNTARDRVTRSLVELGRSIQGYSAINGKESSSRDLFSRREENRKKMMQLHAQIRTRIMAATMSRRARHNIGQQHHQQQPFYSYYSTTSILFDQQENFAKNTEAVQKLKLAAHDFNNRRAAYNRQVSLLRKGYAQEVAQQRAADKAEQEALQKELTRRRLERQRRKNLRSARNAIREKERREQRAKEFQEHLEQMQVRREAKNQRFMEARKFIVEELEQVAPLWLTTPEEVEAAFTPEAEQLLWTRPAGVLGEPNPSLDAHMWQHETHTWHMERTYKSQGEALLEEINEMAYNDANIDKKFWTEERVQYHEELEEKARLRAMVKSTGRAELLRKQKMMLDEMFTTAEGEVPKPVPAPSNQMLQNERVQEREGVKLLLEDPTQFFVFDDSSKSFDDEDVETEDSDGEFAAYAGPTLGSPIALRDRLRERSHQNSVFPEIIGKNIKADTRTEREKRQQEREERMWAAAQAETHAGDMDIELAAEQQTADDLEPDLDYDENDWDSDEEEWKQGVDPEAEKAILYTPRERRFKEEDIDWVLGQLDGKVKHFEQQLKQDIDSLKQSAKSELLDAQSDDGVEQELPSEDDLQTALLSLTDEQLILLSDLDDQFEELSDDDISARAKDIGLTDDQVRFILERDRSD